MVWWNVCAWKNSALLYFVDPVLLICSRSYFCHDLPVIAKSTSCWASLFFVYVLRMYLPSSCANCNRRSPLSSLSPIPYEPMTCSLQIALSLQYLAFQSTKQYSCLFLACCGSCLLPGQRIILGLLWTTSSWSHLGTAHLSSEEYFLASALPVRCCFKDSHVNE